MNWSARTCVVVLLAVGCGPPPVRVDGGVELPGVEADAGSTFDAGTVAEFGQGGFNVLMESVSSMLAQNGAEQRRVLSALDQARTRRIHTEGADSRISDVDVAREVTRLSRTSIQMDATRSVMAQANVLGELALKLLGG